MNQHGLKVSMVSADGPEVDKIQVNEGVPHFSIPLTRQLTPLKDLLALFKMTVLFLKEKPTIVHTHTPKAGLIGMIAAFLARVPIRLHTIAGLPIMTARGAQKQILSITEKLTSAAASEVWPNSKSIHSYMVSNYLAPVQKLSIVGKGSSNGIDLSDFDNRQQLPLSDLLKEKLAVVPIKDKIILFIGRIVSSKGIIELIQAFTQLQKRHSNTTLLLAGTYEQVRSAEDIPIEIREAISADPKIVHLGWVEEIPNLLGNADILVHPSHREGFPNVLLQGLAAKCSVVCSEIPGNIDAVEYGKFARLTKVQNSRSIEVALSNALIEIKEDKFDGNDARAWVESYFDRPNLHSSMLKEYKRLLESRGIEFNSTTPTN